MSLKLKRLLALLIAIAMIVSLDVVMFASEIDLGAEPIGQEDGLEEPETVEEPEPKDETPVEEADEGAEDEDSEEEEKEPGEDSEELGEDEEQLDEENLDDEDLDEENDEDTEEEELEGEEGLEGEVGLGEGEEPIEEEEYDPGSMLDGFPATPNLSGAPLEYYAPGSLGSALTMGDSSEIMGRTSYSGLQPGEVSTSKTATPVPGMVNTWDIKVRIEGRDNNLVESTDVVLVIDRSGSMGNDGKMTNAKNAANSFIDTMIGSDQNLRIAIVSFGANVSINSGNSNNRFIRNTNSLKSAVNGLSASGGTHTQAGIRQGEILIDASTAANRFIVLLSDGQPTYSYEPANWTTTQPNWGGEGLFTTYYGLYNGSYNVDSTVGNGSDLVSYSLNGLNRYYVHNGLAAIKAGQDARAGIDGLFTIAVQAGTSGTPILQQIASPGMAYSTSNPGDLQAIYNQIGTQIQTQYALRNAVVTDEMGDGFSLIDGTLATTEGVTAVAAAGGGNNQTITWTIDPAVSQLVPGTTDVRYAEMTYRVEINDEILNVPGAKSNETKLFETNKLTQLNYKDVNDNNASKDIDSPEVDPVLLKIKKTLLNPMDSENRRFNVKISKEDPDAFNQIVELVPNVEDYLWLTSLRHEGTYKVEEISISGTGIINIGGFDISYNIDGEEKENFQVNHINNIPRGDVVIKVTNKLFGEATPDEPLIRVSKTFSGLAQEEIDQLNNFKITITSQSDSTRTRDLFLSQGTRITETNGDITYKWEIEGWPAGTYIIGESGEKVENYEVIIENDGTVTTVAAEVTWNTALWKKPNTQVNNDLKVNNIPPNIVATKLTTGEGVFVWTQTRLSASQRLAVVAAFSSFTELGLTADNGYWYSGDDIAGEEFYFRGYKIQYDIGTGNLHIPQSNQWALIISGAYTFAGGDPADIAVKNTYALSALDVTIKKEVTGNLGDQQGAFDFTVIIDGDVDNQEIFSLSHGESKTLEDISADAVLTLIEDARGHDVTVRVGDNVITANSNGSYTIDLSNYQGDITIEVNNNKGELIDTGISLDSMPYILISILATFGLGVKIVKKRKFQ